VEACDSCKRLVSDIVVNGTDGEQNRVKESNILKEPMEIVAWTFIGVDADLERKDGLGGA
jgi:hypothetical protein